MIKKILLTMAVMVFLCGIATAENTEGTNWQTSSSSANSWLNSNAMHGHGYEDYDAPVGVGVNAILFEINDNVNVGAEAKYDFNNEEPSIFAVVNVNLFKLLSGE